MPAELEVLEAVLGHTFRDRGPLVRALTHRSYAFENSPRGTELAANEQLEFLGDAILGFVVSDILFRRYPEEGEGRLTRLKARLVSGTRLSKVARELHLGDYLLLGRSEEMSGGRTKKSLAGNAIEALIAAIYLDGGLEPAQQFIERHIIGPDDIGEELSPPDYKSLVLERAMKLGLTPPKYSVTEQAGPDHAKIFTVEVTIENDFAERAQGASKKEAGQNAARRLLERLDRPPAEQLRT